MGMGAHIDSPAPGAGVSAEGETQIMPELATLRQVPWRETHYIAQVNMRTSSGQAWECCPRNALRKALAALSSEFGVTMKVGCELEFYLLAKAPDRAKDEKIMALDDSRYCQSSQADAAMDDLEAIINAVEKLSGLTVQQFHAEGGGGQYELAMAHTDAAACADALVLQREAVVDTAARQGHPATFLPMPFEDRSASGAHMHFSVYRDGMNLMSGGPAEVHGLQEMGEHFISGVLSHLPGIIAFLAASPNSYRRIQPSHWTGAFQGWGINNREAPLRLIQEAGDRANCELKTMDGTANPHLAFAAVATAGLLGLRRGGKLPPPIRGDPGQLTREERQQGGIRLLPGSLTAAVDTLFIDKDLVAGLHETLGEPLLTAYTAVKQFEASYWRDKSLAEECNSLWNRF